MADDLGHIYEKAIPEKMVLGKRQDVFWRDLNRWFALMDNCQHGEATQKAGAKLYGDMVQAWQSRTNAYLITEGKNLDLDTKFQAKGMQPLSGFAVNSFDLEKKRAILWIKATGKIDGFAEVIHRAALENDLLFFRATLPGALKGKKLYKGFVPSAPRCKLNELLVAMWCGNWFRPNWMPQDWPPLCIFSNYAIANLFCGLFPNWKAVDGGITDRAIEKRIKELGLIKIARRNFKYISNVTAASGKLLFNSDI